MGLLLCSTDCIVRPKAETVLTMRPTTVGASKLVSEGFRYAVWQPTTKGPVVLARGLHPREHETYWFIGCEEYPFCRPRWIMFSPTQVVGKYTLDIWLAYDPFDEKRLQGAPAHFTGVVNCTYAPKKGTFRLRLKDQQLRSVNGDIDIAVSGSIVATQESADTVNQSASSATD